MAMNKNDMANAIIKEMDTISKDSSPTDSIKTFSNAIKTYLEKNMEINFSWSAIMPPPASTPDTTTSYVGTIKFISFTLPNPPKLELLGVLLPSLLASGLITPPTGFLVPPTVLLPIPFKISLSKKKKRKDVYISLCKEIISGIKLMINPIPLPGIHASFVVPTPGAIMTSIK